MQKEGSGLHRPCLALGNTVTLVISSFGSGETKSVVYETLAAGGIYIIDEASV